MLPKTMSRLTVTYVTSLMTYCTVTCITGAAVRGDIMLLLVFLRRSLLTVQPPPDTLLSQNGSLAAEAELSVFGDMWKYILAAVLMSYISYFTFGGYLQYTYYIKRKHEAKEWKCQPDRWLTPENERHEILLGTINMTMGATYSGVLAWYVSSGGWTTMYFDISEHSLFHFVFWLVFVFLFMDAASYYYHKLLHTPFMYKNFHKWHHRYHSPTVFSAVALHPVEFVLFQAVLMTPVFLFPIHAGGYVLLVVYLYYYGMVDHSGIKMEGFWPWQPNTTFHDDHHKYFHTNFGFNLYLWDWLHDTLRLENRHYTENTFGGKGKRN